MSPHAHSHINVASYWQLCISPPATQLRQCCLDIRTDDRDVSGEGADRRKEVTEQNEDAVELDQKSCKWPTKKD